jgi:hypothetical protein
MSLDILFTIAAVVCDGSRDEVDIVTNNPGAPGLSQELGERAVPGLVRTERRNQRTIDVPLKEMENFAKAAVTPSSLEEGLACASGLICRRRAGDAV